MIEEIISVHPLLFHSIIALTSIAILAKSADLLVFSISEYAKKLGVSDYLIGFIVISIATALPEFVASVNGTLLGSGQIVFGTIMGSNLFKIPSLGLILLLAKNMKVQSGDIGNAPIITLTIVILPILLVLDGYLSRMDGVILLMVFGIYIIKLWKGEGKLGKIKKSIEFKNIFKDVFIFALALVALLLSSRWVVFSSLQISKTLNISPYLIGLIVIGIGSSAPELTIQIRSILKKRQDIAFGNVLGSLVANSALVLGVVAIIKPVSIQFSNLLLSGIFMIICLIMTLIILNKETVTWKHGSILIGVYILFLILEIFL